ncbi:MAG: HD-GYP domain-containing protein [Spirochaetaceae bacterium]
MSIYVAFVCLGSVVVLVTGSIPLDPFEHVVAFVLLTLASFLTQVYELEISPKWYFSTNVAIATTAVFIGGMPFGVWVMLLSTLPAEILLRWGQARSSFAEFASPVLFNTAQLLLSVSAAALVYTVVYNTVGEVGNIYISIVAAFIAYVLTNGLLVAGVVSLQSSERFLRVLRSVWKNLHLQFITMGVLAILMTSLYSISPAHLALTFVPLVLVHYATSNYLRLRKESDIAFRRIAALLAERDEYTGAHSDDVEKRSVRLADAAGLGDEEIEAVRVGSAIHDIGKIAIPDAILKKLGPLSEEEFETMKKHTTIGAEIIRSLDIYRDVVPIVRHEHERWDGTGYPDGLEGERIPIGARIIAVADVYSALTTERPYRPPQRKPLRYTHEEACDILSDLSGTDLDPSLVAEFLRLIDKEVDKGTAEGGR